MNLFIISFLGSPSLERAIVGLKTIKNLIMLNSLRPGVDNEEGSFNRSEFYSFL